VKEQVQHPLAPRKFTEQRGALRPNAVQRRQWREQGGEYVVFHG
jgi:hypothetical protein